MENRSASSAASRVADRSSPHAAGAGRAGPAGRRTAPGRRGRWGARGAAAAGPRASAVPRAGAVAVVRVSQSPRGRLRPPRPARRARAGRHGRSGGAPSRRGDRRSRSRSRTRRPRRRPASESVRSTHQAVSPETAMRAVPTISPICHGRGTRCCSTSKSDRDPEVALAPCREADVAADPRDSERPDRRRARDRGRRRTSSRRRAGARTD